ncbi:MAG: hypothetical protein KGH64_03800 [Candidatus Micrarchaeota archaeon]|nr:hypothetical protein [Candidatus Micrarchaeota archaeon]MDE1834434.1 hypothetical protein [Candidatus Micrarchaeota archaeon]MDE1859684.1 hypothetical protein [Candidatus Micrarchaeota archaeon]
MLFKTRPKQAQTEVKILTVREISVEKSRKLAKALNGRLIKLTEVIALAKSDPEKFERLEGSKFWLGDRFGLWWNGYWKVNYGATSRPCLFYPISKKAYYNTVPFEHTARIRYGSRPIYMEVHGRNGHPQRFDIRSTIFVEPHEKADTVVVVRNISKEERTQFTGRLRSLIRI